MAKVSTLNFSVRSMLVILLASVFGWSVLLGAQPEKPTSSASPAVWKISEARILDPGHQTMNDKGTMITGYTVEATAVAEKDAAPIKQGRFRVTLTAFSPTREMPGQTPGTWYLRGTWTLSDVQASPEALKARYSPSVLRGKIIAETDFNPASEQGYLEAKLLPLRQGRGYGKKGGGTFSGNEKFEGQLTLNF